MAVTNAQWREVYDFSVYEVLWMNGPFWGSTAAMGLSFSWLAFDFGSAGVLLWLLTLAIGWRAAFLANRAWRGRFDSLVRHRMAKLLGIEQPAEPVRVGE